MDMSAAATTKNATAAQSIPLANETDPMMRLAARLQYMHGQQVKRANATKGSRRARHEAIATQIAEELAFLMG
jgi:hypothetical protein